MKDKLLAALIWSLPAWLFCLGVHHLNSELRGIDPPPPFTLMSLPERLDVFLLWPNAVLHIFLVNLAIEKSGDQEGVVPTSIMYATASLYLAAALGNMFLLGFYLFMITSFTLFIAFAAALLCSFVLFTMLIAGAIYAIVYLASEPRMSQHPAT